ncbi:tRNA (adenosine(37)-N6)-threonylcarbamoyltransferase complex ATPase subunit type 1 TsaE [Deinococcus peraridilitoris]|uniref:tRNA threonylcarbamoyladenosine biosynthesis protein TsaE n=1 Tax=Deinococcus peraridilitoris (strain DSM 19664 / LMG 22246 / CIP 109416 / KR-200) TaxID=937777 RepID=L0A351_DEIPD|nr:tRNA (adenosine(37)-N6)-threonylcarbamoyltransferase complex ATPase subunit type 1 TsaE [Deinococcus peraridilitoris]AFZ67874.1 ATPase, YjeE family [Deinococcus peraridilitoris DSM 19664]
MHRGEIRLLPDEHAQEACGRALASALPHGTVVFLEGELGSGKTTLTQGLVRALGFGGEVSSPTYALMQLYPTYEGPVLHVDAYRIRHAAELYAMDLERLIDESRLCVIEWGQLFYEDFPEAWLLRLEYLDGGRAGRQITRLR